MFCTHCGTANPPDAGVCAGCDAPLALHCGSCAARLAPESRFCHACGSPVEPPGATEAAVRKQVTALFADLIGSTAFAEQVDSEVVRSTLAGYHSMVTAVVGDHDGTVAKFMGDGVLVLFGVPEIAEDDAARAVATGLELQRRFVATAASVRQAHGVEIGLRIGVNTGELVVGADDDGIVGDVLNTAARLEAACPPGQVLVGEEVWRFTRAGFDYESLGGITLKGKSDPFPTYRALGPAAIAEATGTPFVGRDRPLGTMVELFAAAVSDRRARLATIIGPPGVGKTRLAAEFAALTEARTFEYRFERQGSAAFAPIADLLRTIADGGTPTAIRQFVADQPDAERLGTVLTSFVGHGDAQSTDDSFWAARRLTEIIAADAPIIVVYDDIQWAAPLFWELLDHLAEGVRAPVTMIALARPEIRDLRPSLATPGGQVSAVIDLDGLDAASTRRLVEELLDGAAVPTDLIHRLTSSTHGNPLFIREFVRMLVSDGVLERHEHAWNLTTPVQDIEVPPTVVSLLATRVERLPAPERRVLEVASVIGTEFDRQLLTAISTEEYLDDDLPSILDRLHRKDLIAQTDGEIHRFQHVLLRDAAYRRLLKSERARLHIHVGDELERSLNIDTAGALISIAHHFEQAHRYYVELGAAEVERRISASRATSRLRAAATDALRHDDPSAAAGLALRGLDLPDISDDERRSLLVVRSEALLAGDAMVLAAGAIDELELLATHPLEHARVGSFRAKLWTLTDVTRLEAATEIAAQATSELAAGDDLAATAYARLVLAQCLGSLGRMAESELELDVALTEARAAGDQRRTVEVLGAAPSAAVWGPRTIAMAGARCLDVLRLQETTAASAAVECEAARHQGVLEALRGERSASRSRFAHAQSIAADLGVAHAEFATLALNGFCDLLADDPIAAEASLRIAHDGFVRLGLLAEVGETASLLAWALMLQGTIDEAQTFAAAALHEAGQNLRPAVTAQWVTADLLAVTGDHIAAAEHIASAIDLAEQSDLLLDRALVHGAASRIAEAAGGLESSAAHARRCRDLLAAKGVTIPIGGISPSITDDSEVLTVASGSVPQLANDATEVLRRLAVALARNDEAALRFVPAGLEQQSAVLDILGGHRTDRLVMLVLAVRQHDLCAVEIRRESQPVRDATYLCIRADDDLLHQVEIAHDPLEVLDQLDRMWVDRGGPVQHTAFDAQLRRTFKNSDWRGLRALLRDDWQAIDHQLIGPGDQGADDWVSAFDTVTTGPSSGVLICQATYVARSGPVALIETRVLTDRRDATWEQVMVRINVGHQSLRLETFSAQDADLAMQRYHEVVAEYGAGDEPEIANPAWYRFLVAHPDLAASAELIATRSQTRCLVRVADASGGQQLLVVDTSVTNCRSVTFAEGAMADALDELDRR